MGRKRQEWNQGVQGGLAVRQAKEGGHVTHGGSKGDGEKGQTQMGSKGRADENLLRVWWHV